jgi:DNA primase
MDVYEVLTDIHNKTGKLDKIRRVGNDIMATCPYHSEDNPSFGVETQPPYRFHCFTCGAAGNITKLIKDFGGDMPDVRYIALCEPHGVEFLDDSILKQYTIHPYLYSRGFNDDTIAKFELGYDASRNSITIPVRDEHARLVYIKYRPLNADKRKYINGKNIKKGDYLYGLYLAKYYREVYITEGEFDAISMWQMGYPAVALGGCTITKKQIDLLSYFRRVILFMDNDKPGREAADKIKNTLMSHGYDVSIYQPNGYKDANEMLQNHATL